MIFSSAKVLYELSIKEEDCKALQNKLDADIDELVVKYFRRAYRGTLATVRLPMEIAKKIAGDRASAN